METGLAGMRALLDVRPRPTGVVVGNVLAAIGALTAAREAGLTVPKELSVIAFHDVLYAAHLVPALTTVAMPLRELGAASVALVMERLEGKDPRQVVLRDPPPQGPGKVVLAG